MAYVILALHATLLAQEGSGIRERHALDFFVGTWVGQGKLDGGEAFTEEHRMEWIQDRNFLKSEYVLKVGTEVRWSSTSVIGYDSEKKKLVAFVFGKNGALARSEQVLKDSVDTWVFQGRVVSGALVVQDRVTQTKVDSDTFTTSVETLKDGQYVPVGKYTYKKKK